MFYIEIMGYVAGTLNTLCFLPQVIKIWRTKQTRDLSLPMYIVLTTGTSIWLIYGVLLGQPPIWVANAISTALIASILVLKIKHG
jgi:MtN3 and saliva related transmembrane protein